MQQSTQPKALGVFALSMISVSAVMALQALPSFAKSGFSVIVTLAVAALLFLFPVALACAELASGWPKNGGVYAWVKEAFGEKIGTLAIWLAWIGGSVVWLPTILSYVACTLAYVINPSLVDNSFFMWATMLSILWCCTLLNFLSSKTSGRLSSIGMIVGSLLPGLAIILFGGYWLVTNKPLQIQMHLPALMPELSFSAMANYTAIALGFAGIEIGAYFIQDTKDPQRTFPRATFVSAIIIVITYILGALAIALIVPNEDIDLSSGIIQAMDQFFVALGLPWATKLFALLSAIGGLAFLNTWFIGPSKGLLSSALNNNFPKFTQYTNYHGSPVAILILQAGLGTILISLNFFTTSLNQFYWIFQTMAAQLLLIMYCLIFMSVIKLRYSQPDVHRIYRIPGGKIGLWLVSGIGMSFCVTVYLFGLVPPEQFHFSSARGYGLFLAACTLVFCLMPFLNKLKKLPMSLRLADLLTIPASLRFAALLKLPISLKLRRISPDG